jgi:hypothetical protein
VGADDGIGTRSIHDADLGQQIGWQDEDVLVLIHHPVLGTWPVPQDVDMRGGGCNTLFEQLLAQQRVNQGTFPGIELAHDDQQKKIVELLNGLSDGFVVLRGCTELHQGNPQIVQSSTLVFEQGFLLMVQDMHNFTVTEILVAPLPLGVPPITYYVGSQR